MMVPNTITDPVILAQIASLQNEIAALQTALISGATRVSYDGKSVDYDDLNGMKQRLNFANNLLMSLIQPNYRKPQAGMASFNRGYRVNARYGYYGGFYS